MTMHPRHIEGLNEVRHTSKGLALTSIDRRCSDGEFLTGYEIYLINPDEKPFLSRLPRMRGSEVGLYYTRFGAPWATCLFVYARCVEDALEISAEWLKEHAPGVFVDDGTMAESYNEARKELADRGLDDEELEERAQELVEQDLTYTESGYIPSWEWTVAGPLTREQTLRILGRQHEANIVRACENMKGDSLARRYRGHATVLRSLYGRKEVAS